LQRETPVAVTATGGRQVAPRAEEKPGLLTLERLRETIARIALSDYYRRNAYSRSAAMTPRAELPSVDVFLPLRPVEALVLTMLSSGERHGYGVRQDILEHSGGRIELEAGSLYRYIRRLEADGLIEAAAARRVARDDDPRRIYYRLTPLGRRVLAAEMTRLRELVRLAEARRIIGPAHA